MKFLTEKTIVHKIVIALVIVILFNFIAPNISLASVGSVLLDPIMTFVTILGDAVMWFLHSSMMGQEETFLTLDKASGWDAFWDTAGTILAVTIGAVAIAVVALVPIAGQVIVASTIGGVAIGSAISAVAIPAIGTAIAGAAVGGFLGYNLADKTWLNDNIELPFFSYSPEEIVLGKIAMLDVNFINPNKYENVYLRNSLGQFVAKDGGDPIEADENGNPVDPSRAIPMSEVSTSTAAKLQPTLASWYVALRNLAIVMLLCILVYVGIRMVISSTAGEKAKYKQMILDWIVAMCLLFCLHYIMTFAIEITESLNKLFQSESYNYIIELPSIEDYELEGTEGDNTDIADQLQTSDGIGWPTNLMGRIRLEMQMGNPDATSDYNYVALTIAYLVLVIYTIMFTFIYVKRVIYLGFLTLIAPLVAMTYPIDKMHDGKAQAFNMWLKEYIFTLLIQPVHALLYTVFVSMAIDFAAENLVYTLICIGFILQAEKIIRKFFGFEKAGAFPMMNTAFGGAMVMQGLNMLRGRGGKKEQVANSGNNVRMQQGSSDSRGDSEDMDAAGTFAAGNTPMTSITDNQPNLTPEQISERDNLREQLDSADYNDMYLNPEQYQPMQDRLNELEGWADQEGLTPEQISERDNLREQLDSADYNDMYLNPEQYQPMQNRLTELEGRFNEGGDSFEGSTSGRNASEGATDRESRLDKIGRKERIKGYMKTAGKYALLGAANKLPGLSRTALRLPLATTLGTIGVAAGLASDNGANVAKFGAAGAGIGYAVSGKSPNVNMDTINNIKDDALRDVYGTNYKEYMNRQSDKAFMKDKGAIDKYKEKFTDYKDKMELALKFRQNGVVDDKIIIKAMKAPGNFGDQNSDERIALAKFATEVPNPKALKNVRERLKERGIPDGRVNEVIEAIRFIKGFN